MHKGHLDNNEEQIKDTFKKRLVIKKNKAEIDNK